MRCGEGNVREECPLGERVRTGSDLYRPSSTGRDSENLHNCESIDRGMLTFGPNLGSKVFLKRHPNFHVEEGRPCGLRHSAQARELTPMPCRRLETANALANGAELLVLLGVITLVVSTFPPHLAPVASTGFFAGQVQKPLWPSLERTLHARRRARSSHFLC